MEAGTRGHMKLNHRSGSPPSRKELARLLRQVPGGRNPRAANRLVDLYAGRLYGLAFRVLSDRDAAEDVVQDVFLALLEGKARYRGEGHPDAFLLRVASFLAIDRAKGSQLQKRKEEALMESRLVQPESAPLMDGVLKKELEAEIAGLLVELAPEVRAAVALRFWQGATVREIASILSSTKSTVGRWIEAALEKLRRPLLKKGFGAGAAVSLLGDLLGKMSIPPPSSGFRARLEQAIRAPSQPPPRSLPPIPGPARWSFPGYTPAIAAAIAVVVTAVVILSIQLIQREPSPGASSALSGNRGAPEAPLVERETERGDRTGGGAAAGEAPVESAFLEGLVLGPDGGPLRGALVRLYRGEGRLPADYSFRSMLEEPLAGVKANRRGGFRFGKLPGGSYRIHAMAPGFAPGTSGLLRIAGGEALRRIRIRLSRGEDVSGVARLEDGRPVEGVRVEAFLPITLGTALHGLWPERSASGKDGRFQISGVADPAEVLIHADRHYVVQAPRYARRGEAMEILLSRGIALAGAVSDPGGAPAAGAEVLAFSRRRRSEHAPWILIRKAVSDGEGRFELPGLGPVEHAVFARRDEFALTGPVWVDLGGGSSSGKPIDLKLIRGETIQGHFVCRGEPFGPATGYAVSRAGSSPEGRERGRESFILAPYALDPTRIVDMASFPVDGEGRFTTPPLPPGEYVLQAYRNPDEILQSHAMVMTAGEKPALPRAHRAGSRGVKVDLPVRDEPLLLSGEVVTEKGKGIPNVQVQLSFLFEGGGSSGVKAFTDQRGVFEVETHPPQMHQRFMNLSARAPDGREGSLENLSLENRSKLRDLRVVIDSGMAISGTVSSSTGLPLAGASVELEQDGFDPFPRMEPRRIKTDRNGRFRFEALKTDRLYQLSVDAEGWARARLREIEVGTGDADFVLPPESVLKGRVVDLEGKPVKISSMGILRYEGESSSSSSIPFTGDGGGSFTIRGLEAGEYSLYAYGKSAGGARQPVTRQGDRISLSGGETVEGIVLVMTRLVALTGEVVDGVTGRPIPGAVVADWDPESRNFPGGRIRVEADAEGRYRMEGLPRGTISLHAMADGYMKRRLQVETAGERDEELLIELTPSRSLLLVVRDGGGRPVSGAHVHSRLVWPPPPGGIRTDAGGLAELPVPATGLDPKKDSSRAQIEIYGGGYVREEIQLTRELIDRGRVEVTLKEAGKIAGMVTDHLGEPIQGIQLMARKDRGGTGNRTNDQGFYSIGSLEPGEYGISATSKEIPLPRLEKKVVVEKGREVRVDFQYPDPATFRFYPVRLVATLEDGSPAAGAKIRVSGGFIPARGQVEPLAFYSEKELEFGPEGTLEVSFEEPGVETIYYYSTLVRDGEEYRPVKTSGTVEGGQVAVQYRRIPRGEIIIRVRDAATGDPVRDYRYFCRTRGAGGSGSRCRSAGGEVSARAQAGEVTVSVEAEGYEPLKEEILLEDHGKETLELRLLPRA